MSKLEVRQARKSYGPVDVLHGVDIAIDNGEFVALVGPSGCGKSTLLRMIAGLESITGGEVAIAGRVVNNVAPKNRDIAMVFQSYALYPHMSVADNMSFSLRLKRLPKQEVEERVARAANILGLESLLDRLPKQLSGGQRQRVAMGRAIVRDPAVFLFDEPLSNLDAKLRVQMRAEIKALHQRLKTTTVYVTHDQVEAMTLADRIVVMHSGKVEQMGTPMDLYDKPQTTFVASFIGSPAMNMINGSIRQDAGMTTFISDAGEIILLERSYAIADGMPAILGIRPENVEISDSGISVFVEVVEPTGSETLVNVRLGEIRMTLILRDRQQVSYGETIRVVFNSNYFHLFDGQTQQRVATAT